MSVQGISGVDVNPTSTANQPSAPASAPPVMPEPQPADMGDPMAAMYMLLSKQRNNDLQSGKADVEHNGEMQKAEQLKQQAAIKKQEDDAANAAAWGIFGKIASVVAIAISAVASVCTCGAASGLCAAACIISTLAFAEGEAHVLTDLTGNPDADKAFQIGAGIAAAVCSGGAGIASLASSAVVGVCDIVSSSAKIGQEAISASGTTDQGWQEASMGLGIGSAVAGAVAGAGSVGDAASSAADAAVKAAAAIVKGATEVGAGVSTAVEAQYNANSIDDQTTAKRAQMDIDRLTQLTTWAIDGIKDTDKSHARALQTLAGAMQTNAQTLVIASARV